MQAPTEPQASPSSGKRKIKPVCGNKKIESCQSGVAMLGAGLWTHVVLCGYVPWGGSRFTYCMLTNSGRKIFVAVVPPLSSQFISSHTLIHFLFWGNNSPLQDRFLVLSSWNAHWWVGGLIVWLVFPSFLFLFGIVRLAPTGRPWGCHREHFSWEAGSS